MRVIDSTALLHEIFETETALPSTVESVELIGHEQTDVFRIRAGGQSFIAHISTHGTAYLERVRTNLGRLAALNDERIPQIAAWWRPDHGKQCSVLICGEIPGVELSPANVTPQALDSLADLLVKVHSVEAPVERPDGVSYTPDDPKAFAALRSTLLSRLTDLPISADRVRGHLDQMKQFLELNANAFDVRPVLIHGDLHRSNIVVSGSKIGLLDWEDLTGGDYAYDLACLKFVLDSIAPRSSVEFIRRLVRAYRDRFEDHSLEVRLRYFLSLAGLVRAIHCANDTAAFQMGRAWRVRACYLHSEAQWRSPLRIDGPTAGAPVRRTEEFAVDLRQPIRGLFYLLAPKRIS